MVAITFLTCARPSGQELRTSRSKLLNCRDLGRFLGLEENRKALGHRKGRR